MEEFIKKYKIAHLYRYHQEMEGPSTMRFGWADAEEIDLQGPVVISYWSKTKRATEQEAVWSKDERTNAASKADYESFFLSLTGMSSAAYFIMWAKASNEEYMAYWATKFPTSDDKQPGFMLKLSELLTTGKKFIMYGRGFKIVEPGINNEGGDKAAEV